MSLLDVYFWKELPTDITDNIKFIMDEDPELSKDNIEYVAVFTDPPIEITFDELLELTKKINYTVGASYEFKIQFKNNWSICWEPDDEDYRMNLFVRYNDPRPSTVGHLPSLMTKEGIDKMKSSINHYAIWQTKDLSLSEQESATEEIIKNIIEENHLEEYYGED